MTNPHSLWQQPEERAARDGHHDDIAHQPTPVITKTPSHWQLIKPHKTYIKHPLFLVSATNSLKISIIGDNESHRTPCLYNIRAQ